MSSEHLPAPRCENCQGMLTGPWCGQCGQRDFNFHRPFREVTGEWLGDVFNFDSKWSRDLPSLLFTPGRLTAEFWAGRRAAQVPPLRSYLFVSLLFFLWLSLSTAGPAVSFDLSGTPFDTAKTSAAAAKVESADFDLRLREWLPHIFVLGLPVQAALSRLLYRKQCYTFLHHLIFALHAQSFVFVWVMTAAGWAGLVGLFSVSAQTFLEQLVAFYLLSYPAIAFRRCFGGTWSAALLRSFVFLSSYAVFLTLSLAGSVLLLLALN